MEALGSPSISRAPMGGGHAFRIPKTIVCRRQVQRQYIIVHLTELQFTASGFFPQDFLSVPPYNFVSFSFWSFFLFFFFFFFFFLFFFSIFASLHVMKNREKKNIKVTIIIYHVYKPSNEHYCVDVFFFFFFFFFFLFVCFLFFCFVFFFFLFFFGFFFVVIVFFFSDYLVKRL